MRGQSEHEAVSPQPVRPQSLLVVLWTHLIYGKHTAFCAPATSQKRISCETSKNRTCVTKYCACHKKYEFSIFFLFCTLLCRSYRSVSPRFTNTSFPAVAATPRGVSPGKLAQKRVLAEPGRCDTWDVGT